jgi:hypothetical protein
MENQEQYYVVSLKHSSGGILTFWRESNAGYTTDLQQAGLYPKSVILKNLRYYHDGDNIAVSASKLKDEFKVRTTVETDINKVTAYILMAKNGVIEVVSKTGKP